MQNRFVKQSISLAVALSAVVGLTAVSFAEEPQFPEPTPQHDWLHQLVGNWEYTLKTYAHPDMPADMKPQETTGTEVVSPIGGFWVSSEVNSTFMNQPFNGTMTIGYDELKHKYVSTWVDSMNGHLWQYEGNVDPAGKVLTLETEGPCPMHGNKIYKFKHVIELKNPNTRVSTEYMQDEKGRWNPVMTINSHRAN